MKCLWIIVAGLGCWLSGAAWAEVGEPVPGPAPPPYGAAIPPVPLPATVAPPVPMNGAYTPWGVGSYPPHGAVSGMGARPYWAPGGYEPRIGSPYLYHDPTGGHYVATGDPYFDHWGPGFHRHDLHGHYRFPYYTYRAPWYYPGRAVYHRDTNFPW
jgi:hypothetical protein